MIRTALCVALVAASALTAQAQQGRKPAVSGGKAVDTAGKATIPVGPLLPGEEKLTAQERAERTFLMPARKKMPSVQPVAPQPAPTDPGAVAIGPPTVEEMAAEEQAKIEAASGAVAPARSTRRHSTRRRSSNHSSARRSTGSKKKTVVKKKSSSGKKGSSSRRRR